MKLDGKNRNLSKICDWHNRTGSALFGGIGGGGVILKIEVFVTGICNLRKSDQILMKFDI